MIKNLTPHAVRIQTSAGVVEVPASGTIARVGTKRIPMPEVEGIPVVKTEFGEVEGLPAPEAGTIFIVSALVLSRVSRGDVFAPGELIRDAGGNVIACKGLSQ